MMKFDISFCGIKLPFELYSIEEIEKALKALDTNKEQFGMIEKIEDATQKKIEQFYAEKQKYLGENTHHFAYIKFFKYEKMLYGIVGGKTNYTNPDLSFDYKKDETDKRYARNFLATTKGTSWDETIIIVNHKPSNSEEDDKQEALFVECYLQRMFNLFES